MEQVFLNSGGDSPEKHDIQPSFNHHSTIIQPLISLLLAMPFINSFNMRRRFFFLFIISIIVSLPAFSQPEKAEAGIRAIMEETKVMGLSVAVVKNNRIIYTHSFGLKEMETNAPLTDDCLFRIASISKSFSATSIMQLVEAKKISLEDDISNLTGFKIRNPKYPEAIITLRMVLSHRSSINDSEGYFTLDAINPDKNPNWAKCYNDYEPGTGYMYCNLNYNMVGTLIEKVSGERFDQYVKRQILTPLKLYGGYCVDSLDKSRFAAIYEYNVDSGKFFPSPAAYAPRRTEIANYIMGYSTPIFSPTGGMKISATDLASYMIMHMKLGKHNGKRIISKKSAREMQTALSEKEGYGLAIMTKDKLIAGKTLKGHTGSAYGLYSAMFFSREEKFGIVVISNGCDPTYTDGFNAVIKKTVNCLYESLILK
jgi:CubicO group peptidase (beta-lactamase class C family)